MNLSRIEMSMFSMAGNAAIRPSAAFSAFLPLQRRSMYSALQ